MTDTISRQCEIAWFSALCDDDYEFLGVPDPQLKSSWEHCRNIVLRAEEGGSVQRGLALAAIEQRDVQIHLQVGDGFADGGLAFAQLAGRGRERAFGGYLGEGSQGFKGMTHGGDRSEYRIFRWI